MNTKVNCLWIAVMTLGIAVISQAFFNRAQRHRIERLEDRSSRTVDLIDRHINYHVGTETAKGAMFLTNTLTISNASDRTVQIWPKPAVVYPVTEAKEDKP